MKDPNTEWMKMMDKARRDKKLGAKELKKYCEVVDKHWEKRMASTVEDKKLLHRDFCRRRLAEWPLFLEEESVCRDSLHMAAKGLALFESRVAGAQAELCEEMDEICRSFPL